MSDNYKELIKDTSCRHVLGISGGKDSAALAIYIKEGYPDVHKKMEYFFTDTGAELPEVYDFLANLEAHLGKEIIRLSSGKPFKHWLKIHNEYLPSPQQRWCTRMMKIKPFEAFIGDDSVISYISKKETVKPVFPFVEDGLVREDIFKMLEDTVGMPEYYKWRSRSGCYFCFFQQQKEWLGLKRNHPALYEKAKLFESQVREKYKWELAKLEDVGGHGYTWSSQGSLDDLVKRAEIREKNDLNKSKKHNERWQDVLRDQEDDDPEDQACLICSL